MSASHSTTTITLDLLMKKLTIFFEDFQDIKDLSKIFQKALFDMQEYSKHGLPEDKNSDEFKKAITLFAKPDLEPLHLRYLKDTMSLIDVYHYLKENNLEIFKNCVVSLPDILKRIKGEIDDMIIDHDSEHQKDYKIVKDFVSNLDGLVSADIHELEVNKILVRRNPQPY